MTHKIDRALTADEIREISAECEARDNKSSTPPEEWRAVAEGDGWTLCKIDTLPDMFALLTDAGEPVLLAREDVAAQLGNNATAAGFGGVALVSLDNGQSYCDIDGLSPESLAIIRDHWDAIVGLMDSEIAEATHNAVAPCSEIDYLREYLRQSAARGYDRVCLLG